MAQARRTAEQLGEGVFPNDRTATPRQPFTPHVQPPHVTNRKNTSTLCEGSSYVHPLHGDGITSADDEDLSLLHEIVRLPMSAFSPRLVPPSTGTETKIVKMLGLDETQLAMSISSQPSCLETPSRAPSESPSTRTRIFSPLPLHDVDDSVNPSTPSSKSRSSIAATDSSCSKHETQSNDSMSRTSLADTLRGRRGLRHLSVITSALFPFDFDPVRVMEEVQNADLTTDVSNSPVAELPSAPMTESQSVTPSEAGFSSADSSPASLIEPSEASIDSNPDLIVSSGFTSSANPSEIRATSAEIRADFSTLLNSAPPDQSQHPAFQPDPFNCTSESPFILTTSTPDQIRQWGKSTRQYSSGACDIQDVGGDIKSSGGKKKFRIFESRTSNAAETERLNIFEMLAEGSPKYSKSETPKTPHRIFRAASSPITIAEELEPKRTGSGGRRTFSNLFKSRSNLDRDPLASESSSPTTPLMSPNLKRLDLERYLRIVTNTPSIEYTNASLYPRHPITSRDWKSRNLKCTNCVSVCCAVCGRACCAFKAAVLAVDNHRDNPQGKRQALERITEITQVFPYGKEAPTFIQCTSGGGNGCGKLVCPDCCGVCPTEACGDTQCRRCKHDPWGECSWHNGEMIQDGRSASGGMRLTL